MRDTTAKKARLWNWMANTYSKQPIANQEAYQKKIEMTQGLLKPEMNVLEIGCGTGATAILHSTFVKHIYATDISYKMIKIAKNKAEEKKITNVKFDVASIENLECEKNSFDVIMAHSLLHVIEDKEAAIQKIHYYLKPGGHFISSTTCIKEVSPLVGKFSPAGYFMGVLPMLNSFDSENLTEAIKSRGFEIEHQWRPNPKEALFVIAKKSI